MTTAPLLPKEALTALARSWRRERRRVRHDPAPEAVHRLRTATRRLTAAVMIATDQFGLAPSVPWSDWDGLRTKLGRLRNLDVTRQVLVEFRSKVERDHAALRRRYGDLARDRSRARRRALTELERRRTGQIPRTVEQLATQLTRPTDLPTAALEWWARVTRPFALGQSWRGSLVDRLRRKSGRPAVHEIRKRLRDLRYGLEWWNQLGLSTAPEVVTFLKDAQDTLGRIRDLQRAAKALSGPHLRRFRTAVVAARNAEIGRWPSVAGRGDFSGSSPFEGSSR